MNRNRMEAIEQFALAYSGRYWDLGNIIAAFAALQMLGFLYALGEKPDFLIKVREGWPYVAWATGASGLLYSALIVICYYGEITTLRAVHDLGVLANISLEATWCRLAIICLVTSLGVAVLILDHKRNPTEYFKEVGRKA